MLLRVTAFLVAAAMSCTLAMTQGAKPNDAQIAHIAYTAGDIDIKAAQLALQKSTTKDVRGFAKDMVRDHKAVNDQALALVKESFAWIAAHEIFPDGAMGAGRYEDAILDLPA